MNHGTDGYDRREILRQAYVSRVNRVINYIQSHLDGDLRLARLAEIANFSSYHFHRIFHAMVGETPNQFIRRVRVETAAMRLAASPRWSITQIARMCGYSSSSVFAREFREAFGMSATQFRHGGHRAWRKIRQADGKNRES
ncbi:helix-turn-helix transcriptional regulator, partial [Candidatus Bipolaricaulota bacterium]|nr:helix-turn-helix transcriptional regulator [Candidatus Bipolaricaulota bacterium]